MVGTVVTPYHIRVNGRPTENKIFNPFVTVCMRFLFVSHSANALIVRRGPYNPAESTKLGTYATGKRRPLVVRQLCAGIRFVRNSCAPNRNCLGQSKAG